MAIDLEETVVQSVLADAPQGERRRFPRRGHFRRSAVNLKSEFGLSFVIYESKLYRAAGHVGAADTQSAASFDPERIESRY